jgi:hypothetical protein
MRFEVKHLCFEEFYHVRLTISTACCLFDAGFLLDHEDGGDMFLRNVG